MSTSDPADRRGPDGPDRAADLPPVIARLWGRSAPPRRGPKPALSVERIVRAAVDLADAEGLAAVSMARVAESLGDSSMALYRYVEGKDELLVLIADAGAEAPTLPPLPERAWRAGPAASARAAAAGGAPRPG